MCLCEYVSKTERERTQRLKEGEKKDTGNMNGWFEI